MSPTPETSTALVPVAVAPALLTGKAGQLVVPVIIADAGGNAPRRFVEFFTANIRNANTRAAYSAAVRQFFAWCDQCTLTLSQIEPVHVAAYIEQHPASPPTVKQHLAALKQLFDYLVIGQIMPTNPAASVRGPRHSVKKGKTPVLSTEDARKLIDSIPTTSLTGLRDRALIAVMVYSFARVSAAVGMKLRDYYPNGKRYWLRLHEKGGKEHEMPAHHNAEAYLDAYIEAAGIAAEKGSPLFRSIKGPGGKVTPRGISRSDALHMIYRRAQAAGLNTHICCHTFRATGITAYLLNGGKLEQAQLMANHESIRTTKLYDRTRDTVELDDVERILI